MTSLAAVGLRKTFGGTAALRGADLRVRAGTVHALLGGNGSGKSTLFKCLAGVYPADEGEVTVGGHTIPAAHMTPQAARTAGLRFVHQDLALFDDLTVAENIAFGVQFPTYAGVQIRWTDLHRRVRGLLDDYGVVARPQDPLGSLRASSRTMVAVARALADQEDNELILLLDEPTAALPEKESQELMRALRARADQGQTIVLVSHRLGEIEQIADVATVLRDGQVSAELGREDGLQATKLAFLVAEAEPAVVHRAGSPPGETAAPALRVEGLTAGGLSGIDLTVRAGEIVGLAGLAGAGKSTVLRALFGLRPVRAGRIRLGDTPYQPAGPGEAVAAGIGYVPEDRRTEGIFTDLSVRENIAVTALAKYWRRLRMDRRAELRDACEVIARQAVRTASAETPIGQLSGGNQQKVLLGRWMRRNPRLMLLDEPTQGVDVRARSEIYTGIRELSATGSGVLVASTDFDELLVLCDRILVVAGGALVRELDATTATREDLVAAVMSDPSARER
jgi:ribose transport system ATP-binding protein